MGRGRGVSYGGGQSSLDYLFGGGAAAAAPKPKPAPVPAPAVVEQKPEQAVAAPAAGAGDDGKAKGVPPCRRRARQPDQQLLPGAGPELRQLPHGQSVAALQLAIPLLLLSSSSPFASALLTSLSATA